MTEKKDDKPLIASVAILLCAILLIGGYYWFVMAPEDAAKTNTQTQGGFEQMLANSESAQAMFLALDKQKNFGKTYHLKYTRGGLVDDTENVELYRAEDMEYVGLSNSLFTQKAYYTDEKTTVCQTDFEMKEHCAQVNGSNGTNVADALKPLLISYDPNARTQNQRYFTLGVIKFKGSPQQKKVANRSCTYVEYTVDYSNLTKQQLELINVSPAEAVAFRDFEMGRCFDNEYGITLQNNLHYKTIVDNQTIAYKLEYSLFEVPPKEKMQLPAELESVNKVSSIISDIGTFAKSIDTCLIGEQNLTKCILANAVTMERVDACGLIKEKNESDKCAMRIVLTKNDPRLCEQTGGLKDECYLNYAYINKDVSYCNRIESKKRVEQCVQAIETEGEKQ